jgi:hypothetical protein
MNADTFNLILFCLIVAIAITAYEMNEATKVQYRKGCRECATHKREAEEAEKRRQAQLAREYEERTRRLPPGAGEGEDVKQEPPKRPGGGWMA